MVAELFSCVHVGDMYFHHGGRNCFYGITNRHGGMCISPRVQDYSIRSETRLLYLVDDLPFDVRLKIVDFNPLVILLQPVQVLIERGVSVYAGLSRAQQVEFGPLMICTFIPVPLFKWAKIRNLFRSIASNNRGHHTCDTPGKNACNNTAI